MTKRRVVDRAQHHFDAVRHHALDEKAVHFVAKGLYQGCARDADSRVALEIEV